MSRPFLSLSLLIALAFGPMTACSDETPSEPPRTPCTTTVAPSEDDTTAIQEALIDASAGDVICLEAGTYAIEAELSLSVRDVTVRGEGATREDVVIDFATQTRGDDGITVTADGFTIQDLSIKNTPGNGIVVTGTDASAFRNLKVSWDAGSVIENGAYAVYPVGGTRTLIEDCEIIGASDAGIYVGQTRGAIVRNNVVHGNVAGIEIENSDDAQVYDNHTYDNAAGILVFVLPNLEKKDGLRTLVRDNLIENNNRANFAPPGSIVASVPAGTGILLLASDENEVRDNEITGNISAGILAAGLETIALLFDDYTPDPETDAFLERTYIYGNTYAGNGTDPQGALSLIGVSTLEDTVWDGMVKEGATDELCFGDEADGTFRNFGGVPGFGNPGMHSTDTTPHLCHFEPLTFEPLGIEGE